MDLKSSCSYFHKTQPSPASVSVKMEVLKRCFEDGEPVSRVAAEIGYTRVTIYQWRRIYLTQGENGLMQKKRDAIPRKPLEVSSPLDDESNREISALRKQVKELQMQVDIISEAMSILKKDQGVNRKGLKNREKMELVHALQDKYDPKLLGQILGIPKSSYYYHLARKDRISAKEALLEKEIQTAFNEIRQTYGYRSLWNSLKKKGIIASEKVIRRM
ncbi:MAG: IS3 family transposase [Gallicola sp.]|nr:IS3 family transposase [Gallicola sp.]